MSSQSVPDGWIDMLTNTAKTAQRATAAILEMQTRDIAVLQRALDGSRPLERELWCA